MKYPICSLLALAAAFAITSAGWAQNAAPTAPATVASTSQRTGNIPKQPDPWPGMKRLLVVADVQTGFQHDSINHAMAVIEQLGREHHEWATIIRTDSRLITKQAITGQGARYAGRNINAHDLGYFDAVFFLGSGAGTLNEQQKADLLSFVKEDGKGLIVGHAASVAYFDWPDFISMIGGFMDSEYPVQPMTLINENSKFPGANAFAKHFSFTDQFPVMRQPFSSKDVNVILRVDASKLTPDQLKRRPDGDIPVVWTKPYGKGRVYNLTIGHQEDVWNDKRFREMARQGILWAMGGTPAPQKPAAN